MTAPLKFGFIPSEGPRRFREAIEEVRRAEELGFDSVWIQERHLIADNFWSSPLVAASGFLAATSRIIVGTDILVFPFYHAVRLAEDIATLDILSGGRFVFGTAIGYKPDEFALYGTAQEGRGKRFEEGLKLMKRLWTEDEHFEPKPLTKPHPPLWIGGWGPLQIKRAALLGDAWLPGVSVDLPALLERKKELLRHRAEAGLSAPTEWPLTREVVIAKTSKEAREHAEQYLMPFYRKVYAGQWRHQFITPEVASSGERLAKDRFIIGDPAEVIAGMRRFAEAYGATHLISRLFTAGVPHGEIMRSLTLLAEEVMPAFRA